MMNLLRRLVREEEGQGMVEYGLIIALVAIVLIGAFGLIAGTEEGEDGLWGVFTRIGAALNGDGE